MKKVMEKEIVLCREEEGEVLSYPTLWDAYRGFKEVRRWDKEVGFNCPASEYYWIFRTNNPDGTPRTEQEIKFYVRNNKMYYKMIGGVTRYEKV